MRKRSKWIGDENRANVFSAIVMKPSAFSELLGKTNLSRATLSKHLRNLQKEGRIERTILGKKKVYQARLDEEKIMEELKLDFVNTLIQFISRLSPDFDKKIDSFLRDLAKDIIVYGKKEALERRFGREEPFEQPPPIIEIEEVKEE